VAVLAGVDRKTAHSELPVAELLAHLTILDAINPTFPILSTLQPHHH
jgi:hypothetical protein